MQKLNVNIHKFLVTSLLGISLQGFSFAGGGAGVSGGVNLLTDSNARATALAGSVGADRNEITSYYYNPASLSTLETGQIAISYASGISDDAFSQIQFGKPLSKGTLGASFSHYDGGDFDFFDGVSRRNVNAQTDMIFSLGYGVHYQEFDWGINFKYLSSELIEKEKASTVALDFGLAMDLTEKFRYGVSVQNIGGKLKFDQDGDDLPKVARFSGSYLLRTKIYPTTLFIDVPYLLNESELNGSLGLESKVGPMALRIGYKTGIDLGGLVAGAGFTHGQFSLDYGFGLIEEFDSQHKVSLSMKFGNKEKKTKKKVQVNGKQRLSNWVTKRKPYYTGWTSK